MKKENNYTTNITCINDNSTEKEILLAIIGPIAEIKPETLFEKADYLKGTDGEGWAIGEMVKRAANFIPIFFPLATEPPPNNNFTADPESGAAINPETIPGG